MSTAYDPLNVEHALAGYLVPLTPAERREVVHRRTMQGWSAQEISERHGMSARQVVRDRTAWTPQPAAHETTPAPVRPYPQDTFDDEAIRAAAARFIGAVHDLDNAWEMTATMPPDDVRALCVVLAACCNPNQPINHMLAWVDHLTNGIAS